MNQHFFQSQKKIEPNTGGIGNAMVGIEMDYDQNIITIHDSSIINNNYYGIINQTQNPIDATNNWWGRKEGPNLSETLGFVNTEPWKEKDLNIIDVPVCCSNVLFIPGFEASRLYKNETGLLGTTTNTLWEPNRNDDIRKLYMDSKGKSIDQTIYTKDVLEGATGIGYIYKSFITEMNSLVSNNSINEWKSLPYDWRNGVYDMVDNQVLESIYQLASTSKTGKITMIAHSNGGLFAKAIIKKLEEKGISSLVDNLIFITVPELGTSESILSMLNGYDQSILSGLVLSKNNARTFSQNLPGAYGLLPSRKFFEKNPLTVISDLFTSNSLISSFQGMKNFLLNNSFSKASSTDTNIPLLLNSYLLSLSDSFHVNIDSWKPATSTKTLSIFGWGMPTSQSITYKPDTHCNKSKNLACGVEYSSILDIANSIP